MSNVQYEYLMDKIPDEDVFKAVMFACKMISKGKNVGQAIRIASNYYDVDIDETAHYVAQRGGRRNAEKSSARAEKKNKAIARDKQKEKVRKLEIEMIKSFEGKPFFISYEEKKIATETGFPITWFRNARYEMREEGVLSWETLKDNNDHIIGTWFLFKEER